MTVKITKAALNLREELASLRNQGGAYEESKFYLDSLVTNGTFDTGTTGWLNISVDSMSVVSGKLEMTKTSGTGYIQQIINLVVGKTYTFSATAVNQSGSTNARLGTTYLNIDIKDFGWAVSGDISHTFKATTSTVYLSFAVANGTSQFDNISIYEVAPNLVTNGTFDSDSGWTKGTGWSISGGVASCDGTQTAGSNLDDTRTALFNAPVITIQFTISGNTAGSVQPRITGGSTVSGAYVSGNGVKTVTLADTGNNSRVRFTATSDFVGSIDNVIVTQGNHHAIHSTPYGYEIKDVYIDGDLAREGEAYDYTVHDGFIQPTIEPTASTETCLIGVRK